ncbi:fimbrial biogenesis outer membrane usher protein [Caballeronia sp. LP006]|uniref:fimbria/pilus outer membrane usher protein n=1 Tax=Caballeronia sp. LP006 TaxID=3038552 RepID=UPI00285513C0|nr:fimbria/pilus outer membrane usher protein [Caballeronia sp. LP006]MDR5828397.1 fimbrial biogenesis outer membrane usher protein [Caballeronia sp. LP006]
MNMQYRSAHVSGMRLRPISLFTLQALAAMGVSAHAWADSTQQIAAVEFNEQFLENGSGEKLDISRFNKGQEILPGTYRADTYVNAVWKGKFDIDIREAGAGAGVVAMQPCVNADLLDRMGVDLRKLSPEASAKLDNAGDACLTLPDLIAGATASFDNGEQRLDVSVPQIAMNSRARGYVDPKYWDDGINAGTLQYNANVYHSSSGGYNNDSQYLGLIGGINAGPWRFRYQGNLTHNTIGGQHYQSVQTYVQRSFRDIKSQLTAGDTFTDGALFDSYGVRGVTLGTDDRMYPESQRGYAPVVHGIANSNARVQVRQNGNIIYETTVAPGAFEINDLYPTGYGGNLDVIVTEADGSQHISTVPYAAAVNALRPGVTRYSATIGQYRDPSIDIHPFVSQATVQHGVNNLVTLYGGMIGGDMYFSGMVGAALNTSVGAFGLDVSHATASFKGYGTHNGASVRLSFSRLFEPTNTNIAVAAYRYSTNGFYTLQDAVALRQLYEDHQPGFLDARQKSRVQFVLNQSLGEGGKYGSVYAVGSIQNYWNRSDHDTQFQIGYSNSWRRLTYGVSAVRQYQVNTNRWDNRIMLNLMVPLGFGAHAPQSSTTFQHDTSDRSSTLQESVTGTLGADNAFSYGVNANYSDGGNGSGFSTSAGGNVGYMSPFALMTANASTGRHYSQVGAGISGGVVAWRDGVAFTPNMGDTVAVVEAKDAAGARLANGSGLRVDRWGHAVISGMQPYSNNEVEIDPKGLPLNIALKSTVQRTAPTAGAVVALKFETENLGKPAVMRVTQADGTPLPFGAEVFDGDAHTVGTVAQGSRIIATGLKADAGALNVKWGDGASQRCVVRYQLPQSVDATKPNSISIGDGVCQ